MSVDEKVDKLVAMSAALLAVKRVVWWVDMWVVGKAYEMVVT